MGIDGNIKFRSFKNGKINLMINSTLIGAIVIEDMDKISPFIKHLDVKPKYQHKGYGTILLQHAISKMENKEAVSLYVGVLNEKAIRFYRRHGFFISFVLRKRNFYCMTKKL